jgi:uncharacterized membrane protein YhaH (DUF805 family)
VIIGFGVFFFMGLEYAAVKFFGSGVNMKEEMASTIRGHIDNFFYAYLLILIVNTWITTCISAKRWHDRNRSGLTAGLVQLICLSYLGMTFVKANVHAPYISGVWIGVSVVYYIAIFWTLVECGIMDGTKGNNKYGPSPKGIGATPDVF